MILQRENRFTEVGDLSKFLLPTNADVGDLTANRGSSSLTRLESPNNGLKPSLYHRRDSQHPVYLQWLIKNYGNPAAPASHRLI